MKPRIILCGLFLFGGLQLIAQGKTINIPDIKLLKPGSNLVAKIESIQFFVTVKNGKVSELSAKNSSGQNVPVSYTSTARISQTGTTSLDEKCEACVQVEEEDGKLQVKCYEISCKDAVALKPALNHSSLNIIWPDTAWTGKYTIFKDKIIELKASYTAGELTAITGASLTNEKVSVQYETGGGVSHARARVGSASCFIVVTRTLPDGSTIKSYKEISCNKLPKPKNTT
jgi:hypothetical protein